MPRRSTISTPIGEDRAICIERALIGHIGVLLIDRVRPINARPARKPIEMQNGQRPGRRSICRRGLVRRRRPGPAEDARRKMMPTRRLRAMPPRFKWPPTMPLFFAGDADERRPCRHFSLSRCRHARYFTQRIGELFRFSPHFIAAISPKG